MNSRMPCSITDGRQYEDAETCSLHGCEMDGEFCPECENDNYDRNRNMETVAAEIERDCTLSQYNRLGRSQWIYRRQWALDGYIQPDPRNDEQRVRGVDLDMRLFMLRINRRKQAE